ncbi:hypothetical protein NEOLEDRAFT_1070081, partial [Neolentinus lepideus HHB14362 ss-1]
MEAVNIDSLHPDVEFPPGPPTKALLSNIIRGFTQAQAPDLIEESGCAVCGMLCPNSSLSPLQNYTDKLYLLVDNGRNVTCIERKSKTENKKIIPGPILDGDCNRVCPTCSKSLNKDQIPT